MAKTKNQEGTCSTPVKGQVNHSHPDKNQGSQHCETEEHLCSTITNIKRGNATVSSSKFGKRSRSSSPRQQDSSPRRSPRTVVPQDHVSHTELSGLDPLHQVTDRLSQKTTTPAPKGRWKKGSSGDIEERVSKTSLTSEDQTSSPKSQSKTVSPSSKVDLTPEGISVNETVPDQSRIFVYQNIKHAISGLPAGTKTSEGTATPIVYIRDVLQGEEQASVARSSTISGCELRKHLLKTLSSPTDMASDEPSITGNKKKVSPKKGSMQTPVKNENHDLGKNVVEKPSKTKSGPKSLIKDNAEKKENLKGNSLLLKECPVESPSNGAKESPSLDQNEKVKSKKKRRSPSSANSVENKNMADTVAIETRLPTHLGHVEITLNNGDQLSLDSGLEEVSGSHPMSTSPTLPRDGDLRHGRRIRSPSVRYADDMILFPLKSPRKSPKFGSSRDSPEDRQDKILEREKPSKMGESEKLTKTAECQTSELYALLTKTLSNDKIITPSRRKSPIETAVSSDSSQGVKKHTGAVREINFSEGVKTNTRDSQIQVQMEEHLANVHKEELSRLKQEPLPDSVGSQSTSTVSYNKDNSSKGDSRQSANIDHHKQNDSKQKSANKSVSKPNSSKVSDSKPRGFLKNNKQIISKPTDIQQSVSMLNDPKETVSMSSDSMKVDTKHKPSNKREKTDSKLLDSKLENLEQLVFKQKSSNKSVQKQNVSKQSEPRQHVSKQSDSKQNDFKSKSADESVAKEIDSKERDSVKTGSIGSKIDSKHKSKTKNSSEQMEDSKYGPKKNESRKGNSKHKGNTNSDSEHLSELKQNRNSESGTVDLQCDSVEHDSKPCSKPAVKTDPEIVKLENVQSGRVSFNKKDLCGDTKTSSEGDGTCEKLNRANDIKIESDKPTDKCANGESNYEETKSEKCKQEHGGDITDSVEKFDSFVSQKPKKSNLFSLISRVKSNLECPNPLTEFLNSPLYEPPPSGDEEEDISDESFTALDQENTSLLGGSGQSSDKDNNVPSTDTLLIEIPDDTVGIKAGSSTTKDTSKEKHWRKTDQDKNSLEDLLHSDGQDEDRKLRNRTTKSSPEKNLSPCRITRSHASPSQSRLLRRNNSPDKNTIYPADVILVNKATSSSDNIKSPTSSVKKTDRNVEDSQSMVVTSTDADSTTDDSPARKNIFDLLMCSYNGEKGDNEKKDEAEGKKDKEKEKLDTDVADQQIDNVPVKQTQESTDSSECNYTDSKRDLDENKKSLQVIDSKKESKTGVPNPVDTVDLTCDENCIDSFSDEVEQEPTGKASPMIGHSGSAPKVQRSGTVVNDTPDHPKTTEPRPLDVLKRVEMDTTDKMSAFQSKSLDEYLQKMKMQGTRVEQDDDDEEEEEEHGDEEDEEEDEDDEEEEAREFEEELEPDFDEVDGMVFVSFPSEETLSAHIEVERKTRIGKNENLLLGISRLRNLRKKRDHIQMKYKKRIHRLKALKAQGQLNQNLRGMHKALEKYQKLYRTELYAILKSKNKDVNFKSPQKTSDITKIKGWKKKFGNTEQLAEATGLPISQAGKLHWRTEARLLKNLKPDQLKEIGLNLKKKRRKNLVFTIRKGMSKGDNRPDRNEEGAEEYEDENGEDYDDDHYEGNEDDFQDDDDGIRESWFNDFNISREKEKKSQYMKKQERLKKRLMLQSLRFGPEEETIIRKLGGQRSLRKSILGLTAEDQAPSQEEVAKGKRGRKRKGEAMTLATVSQSMALQALSALDKRFVKEMSKPEPEPPRPVLKKEDPPMEEEVPPMGEKVSDRLGLQEGQDLDEDWKPPKEVIKEKRKLGRRKKRKFPPPETWKKYKSVQCDQPGCRYGCICHLCKIAESGPDHEHRPSQDTPCDKEYCRLGCICESTGARGHEPMGECQKPECQKDCVCVKEEQGEATEEEKGQRQKVGQKKFEALPRRQSTYRLAKNLDAVSRKAMLYYESSEMYCTDQSTRKRKSKESDDLPKEHNRTVSHITDSGPVSAPVTPMVPYPVSTVSTTAVPTVSHPPSTPGILAVPPPSSVAADGKMNRFIITAGQISQSSSGIAIPDNCKNTKSASKPSKQVEKTDPNWYPSNKAKKKDEMGVRRTEFDDITFDEMLESDSEDSGEFSSCARILPFYNLARRNKQRCTCHADNCFQGSASCHGPKATDHAGTQTSKTKEVGDPSSPIVISPGNSPPSSPTSQAQNLTSTSSRINSNGSQNVPTMGAKKVIHTGWHTQWVCLKTSKKKEEEESYEIRLLEMISNCNWENAKQKILSKISNQISREHYPTPRQMIVGDFCISFLPRSDKPAVIPPEVKAKLPKSIFSIRIKVERRSQVLKARLGEFITAQEKILKPSLESQDVIALDSPPPATTTSSSLLSGGISGLSHLQISRHTTPSTIKRTPTSSTVAKTVTSPSHMSPLSVSSPSSVLLKPGMCSKVGAPLHGKVGKSQPNNLVILQNAEGQKYVLASSVTQPNLQFVPPVNTISTVISSGSQNINKSVSSAVSTSTSSAKVSSTIPVMISTTVATTKSSTQLTSCSTSGIPLVISSVTSGTLSSVRTSTSNVPVSNIGIPLLNTSQAKIGGISSVSPGAQQVVSTTNSGVTLLNPNVPQSNCSKTGTSTSVTCPSVINMTFTLPGKSTSHSTVTTHSVPVTLLATSQAVTKVSMATSSSPASSVKGVLSAIPGSLLTKQSSQGLCPSVKVQGVIGDQVLTPSSTGMVPKLVPIVPKLKQDMILIPIPTPATSLYSKPATSSTQSKMTTAQSLKVQQIINASREGPGNIETGKPMVVVKEMCFGPNDNKQLIAKNTRERGDVVFHSFVMSRPQTSPVEEVVKQGKKRKKDDDNNEGTETGETEEKKKKKKKKKKSTPVEGEAGDPKSQEGGKKVSKKRKKKKTETSDIVSESLVPNENAKSVADVPSPPSKKCRSDNTEERELTSDCVKEKLKNVLDGKCDKVSGEMNTSTKCDENSGTNSDLVLDNSDKNKTSDSNGDKNSDIEMKSSKDTVIASDSVGNTGIMCNKDKDFTCNKENKTITPDLHSVLLTQIENSIREYDDQDESEILSVTKTSETSSTTGQSDSLTSVKANNHSATRVDSPEVTASEPNIPTTVGTNTVDEINIQSDQAKSASSANNSSDTLPKDNYNISDKVDGQSDVCSKSDSANLPVSAPPLTSDQDVTLIADSPSQFEMDTESSEGDRQSCETSQNSLNDLKMLATVQKASVDVLQIIEGSKNPEGARHPLMPGVVSSGEEGNTENQITQDRLAVSESHHSIDSEKLEKLVGKNVEIVNSIRHHINLSQDKIRETKSQILDSTSQEDKTEEPTVEDGTWDSRISHEGCEDLVINLSDDESASPEANNPVKAGVEPAAESETSLKQNKTAADPEAIIVIDDEDGNTHSKQQVKASTDVSSNRVTHPDSDEVDIIAVTDKEDDNSDIDIENASDEETGSNLLLHHLMKTSSQVQQPSPCSIHSHKGKRKASLDTIDNMLKDTVEFKEGLVKSSMKAEKRKERNNTRHNSLEKQRRRDLKNGFKDLIEVIFGQDETGQKKPLAVEAIQGASKIKVLHMALNMIKENENKHNEYCAKKAELSLQKNALFLRLNHTRTDLIRSGMPPAKIQEILNKISKTCQFIFMKREMLMKKRLDTLKTALGTSVQMPGDRDEEKVQASDSKTSTKSKKGQNKSKSNSVQPQTPQPRVTQAKGRSLTPILPKGSYTAVPVQLVSTVQVLQMAQNNRSSQSEVSEINQRSQPEIYIDNAEDRSISIKEEHFSDDEYTPDPPLQATNSWSQQETGQGINSSLTNSTNLNNNKVDDEEELDRMNTQSPVFSDVDISENYFVQQDEEDENMETGADDPLTSSHGSSDMEYKVIDTSSHSEVMVGYIPEDRDESSHMEGKS